MSVETNPTNPQEQRAIICLCILAAFADGSQNETERARILGILKDFTESQVNLTSAYQDALGGKLSLPAAPVQLRTPSAKALGYADRGVLAPGMRADFAVWNLDHPNELAYWVGQNPCQRAIVGGKERAR